MAKKIGRNDPCPLEGVGKKYKHCHLNEEDKPASMTTTTQGGSSTSFDHLLAHYNSRQILGLLGAFRTQYD